MSCAPLQPVGGTFARPVVAAGVLGDSRRFCRAAFVSSARVSRGRDIGDPIPPAQVSASGTVRDAQGPLLKFCMSVDAGM